MMQTLQGYYHYEFGQYFKELFVVAFPQILTFALFAFFIQTVVSNKFIGHGLVLGLFISQTIFFRYGFENTLYLPGATPPYIYSDMNGYGHFVPALTWVADVLVRGGRVSGGCCPLRWHCAAAMRAGRRGGGRRDSGCRTGSGAGRDGSGGGGQRRLVLLEWPRPERISEFAAAARCAGGLRTFFQEIRTTAATEIDSGGCANQFVSGAALF